MRQKCKVRTLALRVHDHVRVLPVRRLPPEPVPGSWAQASQGEDPVALQDDGVLPGNVLLLAVAEGAVGDVHQVAAGDPWELDLMEGNIGTLFHNLDISSFYLYAGGSDLQELHVLLPLFFDERILCRRR